MTPEAFAREMAGIGEALPRTINELLIEAARQIEGEIKAGAPVDTGALKQSIRVNVNGTELGIEMLDYGWFQNFGVLGKEGGTTIFTVPKELEGLQPSTGDQYQFGVRKIGLPGRMFVDIEKIVDKTVELINNNLQL